MNGSVVMIVSAFFIIGITVGIIAVFAMSGVRADRPGRPGHSGHPQNHKPGGEPPHTGWDDAGPDDHPRWPGDLDNDGSNG